MASPSVLIGIATRDRADDVVKAIASAQAQSFRPARIAVIDDASRDDTAALPPRFPDVSWQRRDRAQGHVRLRNELMLTAAEDYFASLDDDAWFVAGDELAVAIDYLERNPKVAAVALDIVSPDRPDVRARQPAHPAALFIGCGHLLRLSAVKSVGGYAEAPGLYGSEEKDLCLRLIDAGYSIVAMDGVHVWHNKTARARDPARQHRSGVCNDLVFETRRCPAVLLAPVLAWKTMRHVIFSLRHKLLRAGLCGIAQYLGSFGEAWRSRRPVRLPAYRHYVALLRAGATDGGA
jgi:GT2 family glycosyltransferase